MVAGIDEGSGRGSLLGVSVRRDGKGASRNG